MSELQPGLYESVLTSALRLRLPGDERIDFGKMEPADAPLLLARHLESVLRRALQSPGLIGDLTAQISFCNQLIRDLAASNAGHQALNDEQIDSQGRQLLEILRAPSGRLADRQATPRPTVPLGQNALLVAAKHEPAFGSELKRELPSADQVDLLCAFVRWSGIRTLIEQLRVLRERGVRIRVITTTYTGSTETRALEELRSLGAEVKVSYDVGSTRLHAKAWLLTRNSGYSTAYIGSSNLTGTALHDGLEWNVRLSEAASPDLVGRFRAAFETYWADAAFEPYEHDVFVKALTRQLTDDANELVPFDIQPYPFQQAMLYQLEVERERHGRWHNLIVAATGTGKTVVSAFDFKRVRAELGPETTLLFVAHREEILRQSRSTFRNVLRDGSFGELMVGGEQPREGRHVFASIQSLHRVELGRIKPEAYDVVVVDEFHHAEAATYVRLLEHLTPRLLLGMTATPERTDGLDVKRWFGGRIAVELRLWDALDQGLLCPFQYFGVADGTDLSSISWRRGGYDLGELENIYTASDARLAKTLRAVREIVESPEQMRALGFCVSVAHAEYMARNFNEAGLPARDFSAKSPRDERAQALRELRDGVVTTVFAVDLFNEGLDIPEIDTVLFLRPTESPVVFLQQLGRGLRRSEGKSGLTVLDLIGQQHRRFRFEERFRAIIGGDRRHILDQVSEGFPYLPAGCAISLDRQSTQTIIENIKQAIPGRRSALAAELREMGDVSLTQYLERSMYSLGDVYSGARPGWTAIRDEAGFIASTGPDDWSLGKTIARMLHIDDPERVEKYTRWLGSSAPPRLDELDQRDTRLLTMLHFDMRLTEVGAAGSGDSLERFLERLWANPNIVDELLQLLPLLGSNARLLARDAGLEAAIPLKLHARYTRNEMLAAVGEATSSKPMTWREGVLAVAPYGLDLFAVTLDKSEKRFSPSTRYRDYPISRSLFHWESQSTTSVESPTGQRYLNHHSRDRRILLFVRETSASEGRTEPFLFLGKANYVRHEGTRPIAITWRLEHDMPPDFFQSTRAAV